MCTGFNCVITINHVLVIRLARAADWIGIWRFWWQFYWINLTCVLNQPTYNGTDRSWIDLNEFQLALDIFVLRSDQTVGKLIEFNSCFIWKNGNFALNEQFTLAHTHSRGYYASIGQLNKFPAKKKSFPQNCVHKSTLKAIQYIGMQIRARTICICIRN